MRYKSNIVRMLSCVGVVVLGTVVAASSVYAGEIRLHDRISKVLHEARTYKGATRIITPHFPNVPAHECDRALRDMMAGRPANVPMIPLGVLIYENPASHSSVKPRLIAGVAGYHPQGTGHVGMQSVAPKDLRVFLATHDKSRSPADLPRPGGAMLDVFFRDSHDPMEIISKIMGLKLHHIPSYSTEARMLLELTNEIRESAAGKPLQPGTVEAIDAMYIYSGVNCLQPE